jgi:hypothetical protein
MFRKKQILADDSLELKAEHGPWLILAITLSGDDAKHQATALATELRSLLQQPCFVLEKATGTGGTLATRERIKTDIYGNAIPVELEVKYANNSQELIYAVLVGEFTSIEDRQMDEVLAKVKSARPPSLMADKSLQKPGDDADSANWLVQKYRSLIWTRSDRNEELGPMGAAFATRNPLLPDDYFEAPKVDEFVVNLNKNVEHSLLDCPGKFTVRVATFTGHAVTDFGNGSVASQMSDTTDALDKAALKAHKLTAALHAQGESEAYEFHDRYGSYVMIGSFDSLGKEVATGQFQYNPAMLDIMQKWCGYRVVDTRDPQTGAMGKTTSLKSLEKIPFDIEGKPMAVPRANTSSLYGGSLLGGAKPY